MSSKLRSLVIVPLLACGLLVGLTASASAAPANDNFSARQMISGPLPITVPASNIGATAEVGEPNIGGNSPQQSVWFSWVAPAGGPMVIDMCDDGFTGGQFSFLAVGVRTGATLGTLASVAETAGKCLIRFPALIGVTYHFQVDYRSDQGNFDFKLRALAPPPNDNFASPVNLASALPTSTNGSTVDSGWQAGEPAGMGGSSQSRSVWFTWTAPSSQRVRLSMCDLFPVDGATNNFVAAYTGATLGTLVEVAKVNSSRCTVDFPVVAGTTYRIGVSGNIQGEFLFTLGLKSAPAPANDNFAAAQVIGPGLPVRIEGNNDFATAEAGEPDHGGISNDAYHSVWYRWTPATSGKVRVRACNPELSAELRVSVYTGATLATLIDVGEKPSYAPHCSVVADVVAGTTYQIAVDSQPFDGTHGPFELDVHALATPANDLFANAGNIGAGYPFSFAGTTVDSFPEEGEPAHDGYSSGYVGSVWYQWTADSDEPVIFEACSTGTIANRIALWSGSTLEELEHIDAATEGCRNGQVGGRLALAPVNGATYAISVSTIEEQMEAPFTLRVIGPAKVITPKPPDNAFNLKKAIAKCKKIKGKGRKAKRKRANCVKAARKKAAIIKCKKIKNAKQRNVCIKKARKKFR